MLSLDISKSATRKIIHHALYYASHNIGGYLLSKKDQEIYDCIPVFHGPISSSTISITNSILAFHPLKLLDDVIGIYYSFISKNRNTPSSDFQNNPGIPVAYKQLATSLSNNLNIKPFYILVVM